MKRTTVPTAPLERAKWQDYLKQQPQRSGWLVLTLLLSLGAGFVGALVAQRYQFDSALVNTPDILVSASRSRSAQAQSVADLVKQAGDSVVQVGDAGVGVVVSADGWIVTTTQNVSDPSITSALGKTYTSDQLVRDPYSQLTYIHVPSTGLHSAEFREPVVALGEPLVGYVSDTVAFGNVAKVQAELVTPRHTNALAVAYQLDRSLALPTGTPLYDVDQAIVGLLLDADTVIPITAVSDVVYQLFSQNTVKRPNTDIVYIQSQQGASVISSTVAELKVGDRVLELNETKLTNENDLSAVLAHSSVGDLLTLTVERDDQVLTIEFTLI